MPLTRLAPFRYSPPSPREGRGEGRKELPLTSRRFNTTKQGTPMVIGIAHLQPIVALVAGILILIIPRLLNIIVAVYLILIGVLGLGIIR